MWEMREGNQFHHPIVGENGLVMNSMRYEEGMLLMGKQYVSVTIAYIIYLIHI